MTPDRTETLVDEIEAFITRMSDGTHDSTQWWSRESPNEPTPMEEFHAFLDGKLTALVRDRSDLLDACRAVLAAIERADLGGTVLWIEPPYQAAGVYETAFERLAAVIEKATGKD